MLTPATAKGYSHSALVPSLLFNNLWNESCQPKSRLISMPVLELATKIIFTTSNHHTQRKSNMLAQSTISYGAQTC
jgi:hypothetical protein